MTRRTPTLAMLLAQHEKAAATLREKYLRTGVIRWMRSSRTHAEAAQRIRELTGKA